MYVNLPNFQHSFAKWIVTRAAALTPALTLNYMGANPRSLWVNRALEGQTTDTYHTLRIYGGPPANNDPQPRVSMQARTRSVGDEALIGSMQLFATLLNADGTALRMTEFAGFTAPTEVAAGDAADGHWRIVAIDFLQRPGLIPTNEQGRDDAVFNFDMGIYKID